MVLCAKNLFQLTDLFAQLCQDQDPLVARDKLLESFCPQVYGMYLIKLATCIVLCGGVESVDQDTGIKVRGFDQPVCNPFFYKFPKNRFFGYRFLTNLLYGKMSSKFSLNSWSWTVSLVMFPPFAQQF